MASYNTVGLITIIISLLPSIFALSGYGKCLVNFSNGTKEWHCCDNKEEQNGKCIECDVGSFSIKGEACTTCKKGYYGRKCGDKCDCKNGERCDNIIGCTLQTTTEDLKNLSDSKGRVSVQVTISGPTSNPKTTEGFLDRPVIIYIICTAILAIAIVVCMLWFRHFMSSGSSQGSNNNSYNSQRDYSYAEIDETLLNETHDRDERVNQRMQSSAIETNDTSSSLEDNSYEQMTTSSDVHTYITERVDNEEAKNDKDTTLRHQSEDVSTSISVASNGSYEQATATSDVLVHISERYSCDQTQDFNSDQVLASQPSDIETDIGLISSNVEQGGGQQEIHVKDADNDNIEETNEDVNNLVPNGLSAFRNEFSGLD